MIKSTIENESNGNGHIMQLIKEIFVDNKYNNTTLLNDFNHIKYEHGINDNDDKFNKIYKYLEDDGMSNICNVKQCNHIQRHYRDRGRSQILNEYFVNNNNNIQYTIDIISRIHVYFMHSYDIYRLTLNEVNTVNQQLKLLNEIEQIQDDDDDGLLHDKKKEMMTYIINKKQKKLNIIKNEDKYIEHNNIDYIANSKNENVIDFEEIYKILKENNIPIHDQQSQIQNAFKKYENDKNKFINDILDIIYGDDDDEQLLIKLKCDQETKNNIFNDILYGYIKPSDLNKENLIKIIKIIIKLLNYNVEIDEFVPIATKANINGNIFIKGHPEYLRNGAQFAKMFNSMNGYKEKHLRKTFGNIYNKIKRWKPVQSKTKPKLNNTDNKQKVIENGIDDEKKVTEDTNDGETKTEEKENNKENKQNDVYDLGIRFYFWDSHRYHKHYIAANHANLKTEILNNKLFKFKIQDWQYLENECKYMSNTKYCKKITSNGYHKNIYKIDSYSPFTIKHIVALKLYTDFTNLCSIFCTSLRSENELKVSEIGNWAKTLIECVQCYGSSLKGSKIKKYYRGVSYAFKFEMFVTRFNLPTSTTIAYCIAATRFSNHGSGLVLEIRPYKDLYDVFKFDCSSLSAFPEEQETLFFGGDTVLKITSIQQVVNKKWMNYKKYIEPINIITRMIHGLTIKQQGILSNGKQQEVMRRLINYTLPTFEILDTAVLPTYIDQLLKYHTSIAVIKLNYFELIHQYEWMHAIFVKKDKKLLNILNIAILFCNSDQITLLMPKNYTLSSLECESLLNDLDLISKMDIVINILFEWSLEMPSENKSNINEFLQQLVQLNWTRRYSTNGVLFEYNESSQYNFAAQALFQSKVKEMVYRPIKKKKKESKPVPTKPVVKTKKDNIFIQPPKYANIEDVNGNSILLLIYGYIRTLNNIIPNCVYYIIYNFYFDKTGSYFWYDLDDDSESNSIYLVDIELIKGINLAKADTFGKSDGFVKIQCLNRKFRTITIINDLNPIWNAKTQFQFYRKPQEVLFRVLDYNRAQRDKPLGHYRLSVAKCFKFRSSGFKGRVTLQDVRRGEIEISVTCKKLQPIKTLEKIASASYKLENDKEKLNKYKQIDIGCKQTYDKLKKEVSNIEKGCDQLRAICAAKENQRRAVEHEGYQYDKEIKKLEDECDALKQQYQDLLMIENNVASK